MDISLFSNEYTVRCMEKADAADIYLLCSKNGLYYQYCPPFVTEQSILDDMKALPPNKEICQILCRVLQRGRIDCCNGFYYGIP